ncbi:MAG: hypothetical protein R6U13_02090, partial [Desulfatiglandaceae bacterium]
MKRQNKKTKTTKVCRLAIACLKGKLTRTLAGIKYYSLILITLNAFVCCVAVAESNQDFNTIRNRIINSLLEHEVDEEHAQHTRKEMSENGNWKSIDYSDKSRAGWEVTQHLGNLKAMVRAYKSPNSELQNNPKLRKAISASLDYWLKHDFRNPNWWYNDIGVPRGLGSILLLLDSELTETQRQKGIRTLKRGKLGKTGQNLIWLAEITIKRGILERNPELVDRAFERIGEEIKVTEAEGIQPDYSFHQHGPCLYNHAYGKSFANSCSRLAVLARGTAFAFPQEKINILTSYILDGSRWMIRKGWPDFGADGRVITRKRNKSSRYLSTAAANMQKLPTGRKQEFARLQTRPRKDKRIDLIG